jgi:hypothetical protein
MANYIFTTPNVFEGPSGGHRLFMFYRRRVGISVAKSSGTYKTVRYPSGDEVNAFQEFYIGGSKHIVNDTIKANIIAANIGVTEDNFVAQ